MITYELAKELKDAGFPFQQRWNTCRVVLGNPAEDESVFAAPTLTELIEACGSNAFMLEKGRTGWGDLDNNWNASRVINGRTIMNPGSTPEEAVTRLWLALIKK